MSLICEITPKILSDHLSKGFQPLALGDLGIICVRKHVQDPGSVITIRLFKILKTESNTEYENSWYS